MNAESQKISWVSYLALFIAIVMFSGVIPEIVKAFPTLSPLMAFDFNQLNGSFGRIGDLGNFQGKGGAGARNGFLFALGLAPAVILALGIVRIVDGYGGLAAAEKLISPLFKPLLGIPGICGLAFITSLQSTDGAAGMTKELYDAGAITDKERTLFCMLQLSGDGTVTNFFSSVAPMFSTAALAGAVTPPLFIPLGVIFICKFIGVNILRVIVRMDKSNAAA